jgi:hypothetical protein
LAKTPEQHVWLAKDWPILFHSLHGRTGCGKTRKIGEYAEKYPAGAKASGLLSATYGTTKVVPCYKTWPTGRFSQPVKSFQALHALRDEFFLPVEFLSPHGY